jgi:hypothetical protein
MNIYFLATPRTFSFRVHSVSEIALWSGGVFIAGARSTTADTD